MTPATVIYHNEDGVWWAESHEVDGFSALSETLDGARSLVRASMEELGFDPTYFEVLESGARLDLVPSSLGGPQSWFKVSSSPTSVASGTAVGTTFTKTMSPSRLVAA